MRDWGFRGSSFLAGGQGSGFGLNSSRQASCAGSGLMV